MTVATFPLSGWSICKVKVHGNIRRGNRLLSEKTPNVPVPNRAVSGEFRVNEFKLYVGDKEMELWKMDPFLPQVAEKGREDKRSVTRVRSV